MTPNRRLALATLLVAALALTAGCASLFGGVSDEQLDRDVEYDDLRDRDADVVIDVTDGGFRAVYDLNGTTELSLHRSSFYRDTALSVHGVRYWYPNGTMVTGSELSVDQGRASTNVEVPDGNGTLAFSGSAGSKTFELPAFVAGSYEVTLPRGYRTTNFLLGDVRPRGYERERVDGRERLYWDHNDRAVDVRYYLERDVPLFAGLVVVVSMLGGAGMAYYYREVKHLQRRREEMGLDVDVDDDSRRPPPGMG